VSAITRIGTEPPRTGRWLKDLYPCRYCTKPVPVRTRRDIEHACCERCSRRRSDLSIACHHWDRAKKLYKENNGKHDGWADALPPILEAAQLAFSAAERLTKAARLQDNGRERAQWMRAALSWVKWARAIAEQVLEPMRELGAGELDVVEGMEAPIEPTAPKVGHLRLLDPGAK
jgi:hypothetical protein